MQIEAIWEPGPVFFHKKQAAWLGLEPAGLPGVPPVRVRLHFHWVYVDTWRVRRDVAVSLNEWQMSAFELPHNPIQFARD